MSQPDFIPENIASAVFFREEISLREPERPSELTGRRVPKGRLYGSPGPNQGYAFKLVEGYKEKVICGEGESLDDAIAAVMVVASKRAASLGRAPMGLDLEFALNFFRFFGEPNDELLSVRKKLLGGLAHSYVRQRELADLLTEDLLKRSPQDAMANESLLQEWSRNSLIRS